MIVLNRNAAIAVTRPNWSRAVGIEYSFKTGIYTSRNGTEQREALRQTPRVSLKFSTVLSRAGILRHTADMAANQLGPIAVRAEWSRAETSDPVLAGAFTFAVSVVPAWLFEGVTLTLTDAVNEELVEVLDVTDTTVTVDTAFSQDFAAGTRVNLAYWTRPPEKVNFSAETDTLWTGNVRYDVLPGLPRSPCPPQMPFFYKGHELFLTKPNWRGKPKITFLQERDVFDPGLGKIVVSAPEEANHLQLQLGYSRTNSEDADAMIAFFLRQKGRRTAFWMPTWSRDILPSDTILPAANTFQIEGPDFRAAYTDDAVFQAMILFNADGSYQANRLESIGGTTNSELSFQDNWLNSITSDSKIMWLPLWRFATDTLDVQWLTDTVAETQFSIKTLFATFDDSEIIIPVHTRPMDITQSPPTVLGDIVDLYDYCISQAEIDAGIVRVQAAWSAIYTMPAILGEPNSNVQLAVEFHAVAPVFWYDTKIDPVDGEVNTTLEGQTANLSAAIGPLTVPPGARYVQFRASYTGGVGHTFTPSQNHLSVGRLIQEGAA